MHLRYFEDDIPGSGINATKFLSPGVNKKAIRIVFGEFESKEGRFFDEIKTLRQF